MLTYHLPEFLRATTKAVNSFEEESAEFALRKLGVDFRNPLGHIRDEFASLLRANGLRATMGNIKTMGVVMNAWYYATCNPRKPVDNPDSNEPRQVWDHLYYIPSRVLKSYTRDYIAVRDMLCLMLGYSSRIQKFSDRIKGWKDDFIRVARSLVLGLLRLRVSSRTELPEELRPGADKSKYFQTLDSNRYYHPAQAMCREWKEIEYVGCFDADIVNAHPALLDRALQNSDDPELRAVSRNPLFRMMVDMPEEFIDWLREEFGVDRAGAKALRSRLLNPPARGRHRRTGKDWYDGLADLLSAAARKLARLEGHRTPHLLLTRLEQDVIDIAVKAVGAGNVVLNMHDGLILAPHTASDAESLAATLREATGLSWKARVFGG